VSEESERPECVAGPPVGLIAVKNARGVWRDAVTPAKLRKFFRRNVVPNHRILQIGTPIDMHCAGNVSGIVKEHVFVRFHDADPFVFKMLLEPIGLHQRFRMRVLGKLCSHTKRNFRRCPQPGKGFYNLIADKASPPG
jgi:hypothetical protein